MTKDEKLQILTEALVKIANRYVPMCMPPVKVDAVKIATQTLTLIKSGSSKPYANTGGR